jgi:peptidoglycan/xylan/chitin deacetylase (PgdA/CDA1 family)
MTPPPRDQAGCLVISLDFELYWGVRDRVSLAQYGANILGVRQALPRILELFREFGVHATWATVGFLFFQRREELLAALPALRPDYANRRLCNYSHFANVGPDESADPCHYGASLLAQIAACPGQEIASHTFSHYYCLEREQNGDCFRADLQAAVAAAQRLGVQLRSLVFPRNQVNPDYLPVCQDLGFIAYRGNLPVFVNRVSAEEGRTARQRAARLVDAYVNIAGEKAFGLAPARPGSMLNIPSSRFLRPYLPRLRWLEPLRLRRIQSEMTFAARSGRAYHLWWHPHNFGAQVAENVRFLRRLLMHFRRLQQQSGMRSLNMAEIGAAGLSVAEG